MVLNSASVPLNMTVLHAQNAPRVSPAKKTEHVANVNVSVKVMYATQKMENVKVVRVIRWVSTKKCLAISSYTFFRFTHRKRLLFYWIPPPLPEKGPMKSALSDCRSVSQQISEHFFLKSAHRIAF